MSKVLSSVSRFLSRGYTVRASDLSIAPGASLYEYVWTGLQRGDARNALLCAQTGRKIGYERLRQASEGFASWLSSNAAGPITVMLPNSVEMVVTSLGALEAGIPLSPINPDSSTEEISRILKTMSTDWVVTKSSLIHNVLEAKRMVEEERKTEYPLGIITIDDDIVFNGVRHFVDLTESKDPVHRRSNTALITQKWGDAGQEKVEVSTESLLAGCLQAAWSDLGPGDRLAASVPMFTRYGLTQSILSGLASGAEIVILPAASDLTTTVQRYKVAAVSAVPSAVGQLGKNRLEELQGLRSVTISGPLGTECSGLEGVNVTQHYGPPEGPVVFSQKAEGGAPKLGQPVAGTEVRVKAGGGEVGPMSEGEIWARGPQLGGAWISTGDSGYYDAEGTFYLTRAGGLTRQGLGVWPGELEAVLQQHPGVCAAAVFGTATSLVAAVIPADPYNPPDPTEVVTWLAARTAPHKRLTDVLFSSSLPLTPDGRFDRAVLADRYSSPLKYAAVSYV
ncbi:uncharacterized protein [Halyomorpha halys]|uniref:uncharacterized protein n=1 Tax=Halyomorpha halys TaxID=286706 RepID=UPI0006D50DCD|nr:probable 4-coumarate--CoA ligase 1 [Halyomorpha halys]